LYDDDLTNIEEWLRRLRTEYEVFFNGHRKKPPDDLRARVEKLLKQLSEASEMTYAQRFRYNTIISRFYVYRDRWRRMLMDREMGGGSSDRLVSPRRRREASGPIAEEANRASLQVSLTDPGREENRVREIYECFLGLRRKIGSQDPGLSYTAFANYIARQVHSIREKHGCSRVIFKLTADGGAVKFTAKAIRDDPS